MTKTAMILGVLALAAAASACGGDGSGSTEGSGGSGGGSGSGVGSAGTGSGAGQCNSDPFSCPAGQTCWSTDVQGTTFACLNSGKGASGAACANIISQPSCADGLMCFAATDPNKGVCTPFCDPTDPAHACPDKAQCLNLQTPAKQLIHACEPKEEGGTGGGGGASGSTGSTSGAGGVGSSSGAGGAGGGG